MENSEKILKIVLGMLRGESKDKTLYQLNKDAEAREEFRKMKNIWALASSKKEMTDYQIETLYLNFRKLISSKDKTHHSKVADLFKYAAIFIFAIGLTTLFFYMQPHLLGDQIKEVQYTTAIAENGQISKIVLPDNSIAWLNSGTKITYNNNFAVNNREINLTGQAFFQVAKDKKIPFKVFCEEIEVKVLGTKFNVTGYPNDESIIVALETGKVEILNSRNKSFHYELTPGNIAEYNFSSGEMILAESNLDKFTFWKEGILIFRDDPMKEVIPELERRYNIDIEVAHPDIYKSLFTATIKNETLEEIFKSISFACSLHYKIIRGDIHTKTKVILMNAS